MKPTFAALALALSTAFLASGARAGDRSKFNDDSAILVQVAGTTVAILPPNPARTWSVDATEKSIFNQAEATFQGNVKLVVAVPGQAPVTITGDALTLVPQPPVPNNPSPVAVVPASVAGTTKITASSSARTSRNEIVFSGSAVVTVPGQAPVTIAGDQVTLSLQK